MPTGVTHVRPISPVADRPGHYQSYAIDPNDTITELNLIGRIILNRVWRPWSSYYLANLDWCCLMRGIRSEVGMSRRRAARLMAHR